MTDIGPAHALLLAGLLAERHRAGLSGSRLAAALNWDQSKVSRLETGTQKPQPALVEAWLNATGATPERTQELVALAQEISFEAKPWAQVYAEAGGAAAKQASTGPFGDTATSIVVFQPNIIPGVAQTAGFARWQLERGSTPPEDLDAAVDARMDRRQMLYDPDRQITLLILESAIRRRTTSLDILAGQLDRLIDLAELKTLRLGIVPDLGTGPDDIVLPESPSVAFYLFGFADEPSVVTVETPTRELVVTAPTDVASFQESASRFETVAAFGPAAVAIIRRIKSSLDL